MMSFLELKRYKEKEASIKKTQNRDNNQSKITILLKIIYSFQVTN